jgi:hypothetical protein
MFEPEVFEDIQVEVMCSCGHDIMVHVYNPFNRITVFCESCDINENVDSLRCLTYTESILVQDELVI